MLAEMKTLLWKDLQVSRIPLLAGIMLITIPYLFLLMPYFFRDFIFHFQYAWMTSTTSSQLTMAILAGNIIAHERADRSAEFLAYQGASRKMSIFSKFIICAVVFISICTINLILSCWVHQQPFEEREFGIRFVYVYQIFYVCIGICFFGACWLLSSLLSSPAIAIAVGFLMPIIIACTLGTTLHYFNWPRDAVFGYWLVSLCSASCSASGLISLAAGTWYYIRSKES